MLSTETKICQQSYYTPHGHMDNIAWKLMRHILHAIQTCQSDRFLGNTAYAIPLVLICAGNGIANYM